MNYIQKKRAVILQAGGGTRVINESLVACAKRLKEKNIEVLGPPGAFDGIMRNHYVGLMNDKKLEEIRKQPSAYLGTSRSFYVDQVGAGEIAERLKKQGANYIYLIGGDSTAGIANEIYKASKNLSNYELIVAHIPKTIDNDLVLTDHSPGFGSAARYVAYATYTHGTINQENKDGGIHIIITMGRDSGFLAAASTLLYTELAGPHLVYVPEVNFNIDFFVNDVKDVLSTNRRHENDKGRAVVVVSEGVRRYFYTDDNPDLDEKGGHKFELMADIASRELNKHVEKEKRLGGIALSAGSNPLAEYLEKKLRQDKEIGNMHIRKHILGYLQRGYPDSVSLVDRLEAEYVGKKVVDYSFEKGSGSIIIERTGEGYIYSISSGYVNLEDIAGKKKTMPREWVGDYGKTISRIFREYAGPLIGYVEGFEDRDYLLPPDSPDYDYKSRIIPQD
ncbi:MAG: 6-phosphofructokinase [Candidatus Micrarchaeota archaeon]